MVSRLGSIVAPPMPPEYLHLSVQILPRCPLLALQKPVCGTLEKTNSWYRRQLPDLTEDAGGKMTCCGAQRQALRQDLPCPRYPTAPAVPSFWPSW